MFKTQSAPALPTAQNPPPNPPMFGSQAVKAKGNQQQTPQFNASVLGTVPGPGNTGQKSLLGQ